MSEGWEIRSKKLPKGEGWQVTIDDPARDHGYGVTIRLSEDVVPVQLSIEPPQGRPLSGRVARRLPLDSYLRAAVAAVRTSVADRIVESVGAPKGTTLEERRRVLGLEPGYTLTEEEFKSVMAPRGRPGEGRSTDFYREILQAARAFEAQGKSAVHEIARRKRVEKGTVRQWLFRARQLERKGKGKR